MWQQVLTTFLEDYLPTESISDSTDQYATPELHNMLETATGETIQVEVLTEALTQKGYKLKHTGNLHLEWLMIKVNM